MKATWWRTNGVEPALQVMERIDLGRYICGVLRPSIQVGIDSEPSIAALVEDRQTEAYLLGSLDAISASGVNALYNGGADLTGSRASPVSQRA